MENKWGTGDKMGTKLEFTHVNGGFLVTILSQRLKPSLLHFQHNEEASNAPKKVRTLLLFYFPLSGFSKYLFSWLPHPSMGMVISWPPSPPIACDLPSHVSNAITKWMTLLKR